MSVNTHTIELVTQGHADAHDISERVAHLVRGSGIKNGIVTVFCPSSTSAVTTIEFEDGCLQDLRRLFDEIAHPKRDYAHNARWGDGNGHAGYIAHAQRAGEGGAESLEMGQLPGIIAVRFAPKQTYALWQVAVGQQAGIEQKKEAATHQQDHQRWPPEKADQLAHDRFELFDRIHGP